jgi:hypothetical protein
MAGHSDQVAIERAAAFIIKVAPTTSSTPLKMAHRTIEFGLEATASPTGLRPSSLGSLAHIKHGGRL